MRKLLLAAVALVALTGCLFPNQTHKVGLGENEAVPGLWHTWEYPSCYWERLSGFGGTFDEIIANDFEPGPESGPQYVQIAPTDVGFRNDSCMFQFVGSSYDRLFVVTNNELYPGQYRVGVEVPPGTWQAGGNTGSCYWERLSGFSGEFKDIIANGFNGPTIVTISPTDVGFSSVNCGIWHKIA